MMIHNTNMSIPLLFVICTFIVLSCGINLEERVRVYEQTYNSHDFDGIMSFYADDAEFNVVGAFNKTGVEQIRSITEWDTTVKVHMSISDIEVRGDTVTFKLVESNEWWRLAGIDEVTYFPCTMTFSDGLIKSIKAEATKESLAAINKVLPGIFDWVSKERSEEYAEVMPGGEFIYTAESAKKWLELLEDWRAATASESNVDLGE